MPNQKTGKTAWGFVLHQLMQPRPPVGSHITEQELEEGYSYGKVTTTEGHVCAPSQAACGQVEPMHGMLGAGETP